MGEEGRTFFLNLVLDLGGRYIEATIVGMGLNIWQARHCRVVRGGRDTGMAFQFSG